MRLRGGKLRLPPGGGARMESCALGKRRTERRGVVAEEQRLVRRLNNLGANGAQINSGFAQRPAADQPMPPLPWLGSLKEQVSSLEREFSAILQLLGEPSHEAAQAPGAEPHRRSVANTAVALHTRMMLVLGILKADAAKSRFEQTFETLAELRAALQVASDVATSLQPAAGCASPPPPPPPPLLPPACASFGSGAPRGREAPQRGAPQRSRGAPQQRPVRSTFNSKTSNLNLEP